MECVSALLYIIDNKRRWISRDKSAWCQKVTIGLLTIDRLFRTSPFVKSNNSDKVFHVS